MTPALKTWIILLAIVGALLAQSQQLFEGVVERALTGSGGEETDWILARPWVLAAILGGLVVTIGVIVLLNWLVWRVMGYRIDDDAVYLRKGVLSKQLRKARLDRVQSIDISQPLVPRLFGLAALKFDVAGGEGSSVDIEYLKRGRAEALRDEMLARVRSARDATRTEQAPSPDPTGPAGAGESEQPAHTASAADLAPVGPAPTASAGADRAGAEAVRRNVVARRVGSNLGTRLLAAIDSTSEDVVSDIGHTLTDVLAPYRVTARAEHDGRILRVPAHRVLLAALLSTGTLFGVLIGLVVLVGLVVLAAFGIWEAVTGILFGIIPAIAAVATMAKGALDEANFSVRITPDGLSVTHGLFTTTRKIIPLQRIQAVKLSQPLLWRLTGWWRVEYNIAGQKSDQLTSSTVLLPVGDIDQTLMMLGLVLPDPRVPAGVSGRALITSAMLARKSPDPEAPAAEGLFVDQAPASRWLDWMTWNRNAWAVTGTMLVIRSGWTTRAVECVPHARVQSMKLRSGPLQRALGLAEVELHSTEGPAKPVLRHQAAERAEEFFFTHADTTRRARAELDA
ncbi:PH domain-containing protein [Brevibacterium daeguense]|uniref:PH domain-containing protein n=1 Tax=Brevibacterium daeguense TaxID=909936 RepID=A0ABP8ELM2_9MICO|nr:PH domain-containing protein [Brevibacterium daeguense]